MQATNTCQKIARLLMLLVVTGIPALSIGCSGRQTTSTQDQIIAAGHPKPKAVERETVAPRPASPEAPAEKPVVAPLPEEGPAGRTETAAASPPLVEKESAEAVVMPPPVEPPTVEFADVLFDFDQFTIRSDAENVLDVTLQLLADHRDGVVVIEGHCDERGSAAYNLVLGERRAQAVKRYLQDHGVEASRMEVMTYGKERPVCTQHHPDCWQKNRRAHFEFRQE